MESLYYLKGNRDTVHNCEVRFGCGRVRRGVVGGMRSTNVKRLGKRYIFGYSRNVLRTSTLRGRILKNC